MATVSESGLVTTRQPGAFELTASVEHHSAQYGLRVVPPRPTPTPPPFRGTIWDISPNIITASDPSSLRSITYAGEGERDFLETRDGEPWRIVRITVHVFDVEFDRKRMEFQVHPELGGRAATRAQVDTYAPMFGRLPWELRARVREVEIQLQGGKPSLSHGYDWTDPRAGTVTVHTGKAENVVRRGFMEEIFCMKPRIPRWTPTMRTRLDGVPRREPTRRAFPSMPVTIQTERMWPAPSWLGSRCTISRTGSRPTNWP